MGNIFQYGESFIKYKKKISIWHKYCEMCSETKFATVDLYLQ
jgi:hypothetical protein